MENPLIKFINGSFNGHKPSSLGLPHGYGNLHMKKNEQLIERLVAQSPTHLRRQRSAKLFHGGTPVVTMVVSIRVVMVQCWMIWGIPGNLQFDIVWNALASN